MNEIPVELPENTYPTKPLVNKLPLPDPLLPTKGKPVKTAEDWAGTADFWKDLIVDLEYGGLPPAPETIRLESLCHARIRRFTDAPEIRSYKIHCLFGEFSFSFTFQLILPNAEDPHPTLIYGDGCWAYMQDTILKGALSRGFAIAVFNRTEMAEDLGYPNVPDKFARSGGLYELFPDSSFGAVSAWAWGYHRVIDALPQLPEIDLNHLAVTGHSRGGKTTLLAALTDSRIGLINDNASCAAGSALFRYVGDGGESITIFDRLPSWFGPKIRAYTDNPENLPFDQHCLLACLAPRPTLLTYAADDRWSNPEGMVLAVEAASKVYDLFSEDGKQDTLCFHLRSGNHFHDVRDWELLYDFMDWKWKGKPAPKGLNSHPYKHLPSLG